MPGCDRDACPAGSLIIWNSFLPHGSVRHDGTKARMSRMMHAILMYPCNLPVKLEWKELMADPHNQSDPPRYPAEAIAEERERRIFIWEHGLHVASYDVQWIPSHPLRSGIHNNDLEVRPAPVLTPLGRKLLGLDSW